MIDQRPNLVSQGAHLIETYSMDPDHDDGGVEIQKGTVRVFYHSDLWAEENVRGSIGKRITSVIGEMYRKSAKRPDVIWCRHCGELVSVLMQDEEFSAFSHYIFSGPLQLETGAFQKVFGLRPVEQPLLAPLTFVLTYQDFDISAQLGHVFRIKEAW